MTAMPRTVLITGASSGIGRALAILYSATGMRLILIGRNEERLDDAVRACRQAGAEVITQVIDIRERETLRRVIEALDDERPIDLVIANAGVTTGTPGEGEIEPADESVMLVEVNILGQLNTIHPVLARMKARKSGQIAIVSSIAGLIALPDSPSYCASKSALVAYGQALRGKLRPEGVKVNVVCPGFVTTPMSARVSGWKPFEVTPERAAMIIRNGLARNAGIIAFPRLLALVARIGSLLPEPLRRLFLIAFRFEITPAG